MRYLYTLIILLVVTSCNEDRKQINVLTPIEDARNYVTESFNDQEETLLISDKLQDEMGLNMAIIVDGIVKKGYMPVGFEQKDNYRIYKYKKKAMDIIYPELID